MSKKYPYGWAKNWVKEFDRTRRKKKSTRKTSATTIGKKDLLIAKNIKEQKNTVIARPIIPVGSAVYHISYGPGVIKKIEDGKATIRFSTGKEDVFGLNYCIEKGLLSNDLN